MRVITLTTDFGQEDWFVGTMKGVMLSVDSALQLVDITHSIPPGRHKGRRVRIGGKLFVLPRGHRARRGG